jgi:hypothetical protein
MSLPVWQATTAHQQENTLLGEFSLVAEGKGHAVPIIAGLQDALILACVTIYYAVTKLKLGNSTRSVIGLRSHSCAYVAS